MESSAGGGLTSRAGVSLGARRATGSAAAAATTPGCTRRALTVARRLPATIGAAVRRRWIAGGAAGHRGVTAQAGS
ncbi:MAG: hypothetical protein M3467_06405, partial [Actinomycetota bacterium]|nr:hypothetical protein [Actinomycetota bacterium]